MPNHVTTVFSTRSHEFPVICDVLDKKKKTNNYAAEKLKQFINSTLTLTDGKLGTGGVILMGGC